MAKKALALFELGEDNRNLAKLRAEVANLQLAQDPPDATAALATLESAEKELAWSGASAWEVALLHITRGRAHFLLGTADEALASIDRGLELAPKPAPYLEASAAAIRGQVAAREGRLDDAREFYRSAVYLLTAAGSDHDAAQLWFELANLLADVGDHEGAVQAFRSAGASTGLRVRREPVVSEPTS
jgi:tetratricopeptide (TPR) repeat protein